MIPRARAFLIGSLVALLAGCHSRVVPPDDRIHWTRISSASGDLPDTGGSHQQTAALAAELDHGKAAGMVIGYRVKAPALVWLRRGESGWERSVIEPEFLTIESGGAAYDI